MTYYWLFKTEPSIFSIDDLAQQKRVLWDGVRNYQARNFLRDEIRKGDKVFIYHSSIREPAVVGIARVVRAGIPDPTALDPYHTRYAAKATQQHTPRWYAALLAHEKTFPYPVPLSVLQTKAVFRGIMAAQRGARLSIQPVSAKHAKAIIMHATHRV